MGIPGGGPIGWSPVGSSAGWDNPGGPPEGLLDLPPRAFHGGGTLVGVSGMRPRGSHGGENLGVPLKGVFRRGSTKRGPMVGDSWRGPVGC